MILTPFFSVLFASDSWAIATMDKEEIPIAIGRILMAIHVILDIDNNEVSFFPGHIDEAFVHSAWFVPHSAWFVPVGTAPFFTLMAVPPHFGVAQNEYST